MRLTHLKISGFKSFVDSTTIELHGQRVGIVGPNGCGKSNVMESVRWVLGESSAKELRADAMDAVIFNGSGDRKPISRASVELIFDNDEASGLPSTSAWNQYAQISVKRVIEREKGSTYYINNNAMRRRDVADLFLGTGLGGRAYAIIGQNTISRIVEAKPEELRVFLEEAAGISKYKERRRETELRLRDTKENLIRVEDICRELQKQILKLESQAEVTKQFHALQETHKLAQGQLWLIKKRDAAKNWERTKKQVDQQANALEALMAALRKSEAALEHCRQAHYSASDGINIAQANYYEANAEVSNLENQVKQNDDSRERLTQQLQQINISIERNTANGFATQQSLSIENAECEAANGLEQQALVKLQALTCILPEKKVLLEANEIDAQKSQQALNDLLNKIAIEDKNSDFISKNIHNIQQRIITFESELSHLDFPSEQQLNDVKNALNDALEVIAAHEMQVQMFRANEANQQLAISHARETLNETQRALNFSEAELQSLQKVQQSLNAEGKLSGWLEDKQLNNNARLWQKLKVNSEWTVALEAVLGAKLNALILEEIKILDEIKNLGENKVLGENKFLNSVEEFSPIAYFLDERPPSALVLGCKSTATFKPQDKHNQLSPLMDAIDDCDSQILPILNDWLQGVYCLADHDDLQTAIKKLKLGEVLVNVKGDIFSLCSVTYHGENSHLSGVFERQNKLDGLQENLPALQIQLRTHNNALISTENQLQLNRQLQQQEDHKLRLAVQSQHQFQLTYSKLQQTQQAVLTREKTISAELWTLKNELDQLKNEKAQKLAIQHNLTAQASQLEQSRNSDLQVKISAEKDYYLCRDLISQAEKKHQETLFKIRLLNNKINEIKLKLDISHKELILLRNRKIEVEQQLIFVPMENLRLNLTQSINNKHAREAELVSARNHLAALELLLQDEARVHMQIEQQQHPMRNALEQSRLDAQEARLHLEQCQLGLTESGLTEDILAQNLHDNIKSSELMRKIAQIQQNITVLGDVNLAAIQELANEAERKKYLDSQMLDLRQATQTLEDATLKIDGETREQLTHTFNTVNMHFNALFNTLFAGGQAKLELQGNEILDNGLQVFAQPPGKKNTTIALLSGGEKALTAIALVFAMFKLNPAPFCLMDEVDAPLDDSNTERFCNLVKQMSEKTQFLFVSHNKVTMEMAQQLIGVTMQESGVSRIVSVDIDAALAF